MHNDKVFLAFDFGAESGRAVCGYLKDNEVGPAGNSQI
jgi:hypothetical protein